jgi:hypothetical protein
LHDSFFNPEDGGSIFFQNIIGLHKILGISCVVEQLLASQEGFCSTELVGWLLVRQIVCLLVDTFCLCTCATKFYGIWYWRNCTKNLLGKFHYVLYQLKTNQHTAFPFCSFIMNVENKFSFLVDLTSLSVP